MNKKKMNIRNLSRILVIILITVLAAQLVLAQTKTPVSPAKTPLVKELVDLTIDAFPSDAFQKRVLDGKKGMKEKILSDITQKLDTTDRYTPEQKNIIKPKLPELIDIMLGKMDEAMARHFNINSWARESLTKNLSRDFTAAQLRQLISYFKKAEGKIFIKFIESAALSGINDSKNKTEPEIDPETEATVGKFLTTPIGNKFFSTFVLTIGDDIKTQTDISHKKVMKDLEKELNPEVLNKMIREILEKGSE